MEISNRFDVQERLAGTRQNVRSSYIEDNMHDMLQPSSYGHFIDTRSLYNNTNLYPIQDSLKTSLRSSDLYAHNSGPLQKLLYQGGQDFPKYPNTDNFSIHSEKIHKLEAILLQKDKIIEEFKDQKFQLSREIYELLDRIKNLESQHENEKKTLLHKFEGLKCTEAENSQIIKTLQHDIKSSLKACESYKNQCQSLPNPEDYDFLLNENKCLKSHIESINQEKKQLEAEINNKKNIKLEFQYMKLQEQAKFIQEENDNLTIALKAQPCFKDIKDRDQVIAELKSKLYAKTSRSRSVSQTHDLNLKSHEPSILPQAEIPSLSTINSILAELLSILKLNNIQEIINEVKTLKKKPKPSNLEERLGKMVKDLSPEGTFNLCPTPQQCWKWVRRVVEDYLKIKKDLEKEDKNREVINKLIKISGVENSSQLYKKISTLVEENQSNQALKDKISQILQSDQNALLKDFQQQIDELI